VREGESLTKKVWIIPSIVALLAVSGVLGARLISVPTLTFTYDEAYEGRSERAILTVRGLKCYGTADYLRQHIASVPGLVAIVAYAGKHRVVVDYDATKTGVEEIIRAIEAPIATKAGPQSFYKVLSWNRR
jgi:hypothetical protein